MPLLEGILGTLVLVLGVFLIRARQSRQLDRGLLLAREQTEARILEENRYYKELFELGDASYKEAQEKVQALLVTLSAKDIILTRGAAALEESNRNLKKLLQANDNKDKDVGRL